MTPSVSVVAMRFPLGENLQRVMGAEWPLYVSFARGMKGVGPEESCHENYACFFRDKVTW